jgi:hypothetical protein
MTPIAANSLDANGSSHRARLACCTSAPLHNSRKRVNKATVRWINIVWKWIGCACRSIFRLGGYDARGVFESHSHGVVPLGSIAERYFPGGAAGR